jgi:hypothetical protein
MGVPHKEPPFAHLEQGMCCWIEQKRGVSGLLIIAGLRVPYCANEAPDSDK